LVGAESDLFHDADAATVAHLRDDKVLQVDGREVGRLEVVESYRLAGGFELSMVSIAAWRRMLRRGSPRPGPPTSAPRSA
jgi:hypothetical protein